MKWFIAVLVALLVYFGLGWVIQDITYSMMNISDKATLEEIANIDLIVYAVLAGVYIILCLGYLMEKVNDSDELFNKYMKVVLLPIAAYCISRYLIPPSIGSAILFNLLNISGMIIITLLATHILSEE